MTGRAWPCSCAPGNAGSNTFADHKEVLAAAIRQVSARFRRKMIIRVDGTGASHELIEHLLSLSSPRRKALFTCGWMITAADEDAIRQGSGPFGLNDRIAGIPSLGAGRE